MNRKGKRKVSLLKAQYIEKRLNDNQKKKQKMTCRTLSCESIFNGRSIMNFSVLKIVHPNKRFHMHTVRVGNGKKVLNITMTNKWHNFLSQFCSHFYDFLNHSQYDNKTEI